MIWHWHNFIVRIQNDGISPLTDPWSFLLCTKGSASSNGTAIWSRNADFEAPVCESFETNIHFVWSWQGWCPEWCRIKWFSGFFSLLQIFFPWICPVENDLIMIENKFLFFAKSYGILWLRLLKELIISVNRSNVSMLHCNLLKYLVLRGLCKKNCMKESMIVVLLWLDSSFSMHYSLKKGVSRQHGLS